jgi:hypothetical protein
MKTSTTVFILLFTSIAILLCCSDHGSTPTQDPVPACLIDSVYYLYSVGYQEFKANVSYSSDNRINNIQIIRLLGNVQWNYAFTYFKGRRPKVIANANGYSLNYTYDNSDRLLTRTANFTGSLTSHDSIIYNSQQISAVISKVKAGLGFEVHKFCFSYTSSATNPSVVVDSILQSTNKYSYNGQYEYTFSNYQMPEFNMTELVNGVKLDYGFVNLPSQVIHKNSLGNNDYTATSVTEINSNNYPLKNTITTTYSDNVINQFYQYYYSCQ